MFGFGVGMIMCVFCYVTMIETVVDVDKNLETLKFKKIKAESL